MTRRVTILMLLLAVGACLALAWSCAYMSDRRRAALVAFADLGKCYEMAGRIEALNKLPTMAIEHELLAAETTGLIEKAARSAGVPAAGLVRITPEAPVRLADTAYKEKPTQVLLRNVTLKQLVTLVHKLACANQALHPKSIRIAAPRAEETANRWTAEVVLTYLIYDPPNLTD